MVRAFRESPATMSLCASWILIYVLMAYQQGGLQGSYGEILSTTARGFGYLTIRDVMAGEVWRTLTATFIHFNLLHLGINLFGLFQLGRVLESWYGSGPFLAIYVVIGVVGNGIAVGLKAPLAGWFPTVTAFRDLPSGGGSSVLCGLIALLAVVGWRSRSRLGSVVKAEMIGILAFTALLGLLIPVIDNFGHLGGAIAGAIVGFLHRPLLRLYERPRAARLVGSAAAAVLLATGTIQARFHQQAARPAARRTLDVAELQREIAVGLTTIQTLRNLAVLYGQVASRHPGFQGSAPVPLEPDLPGPRASRLRDALRQVLAQLEANPGGHAVVRASPCYPRLRALSLDVLESPPSPNEVAEFLRCTRELLQGLTRELGQDLLALRQLQVQQQNEAKAQAN